MGAKVDRPAWSRSSSEYVLKFSREALDATVELDV
jgi:hypothetical protein